MENDKDELQKWIETNYKGNIIKTEDQDILLNYQKVLNYVKECGIYKESAFNTWSDIKIADPWIIAAAMKYNYTVVTFENRVTIQTNNKMKEAKIPNVCDHFKVQCCSLYTMMSKLGIVI